jgi:hypothetical protein
MVATELGLSPNSVERCHWTSGSKEFGGASFPQGFAPSGSTSAGEGAVHPGGPSGTSPNPTSSLVFPLPALEPVMLALPALPAVPAVPEAELAESVPGPLPVIPELLPEPSSPQAKKLVVMPATSAVTLRARRRRARDELLLWNMGPPMRRA